MFFHNKKTFSHRQLTDQNREDIRTLFSQLEIPTFFTYFQQSRRQNILYRHNYCLLVQHIPLDHQVYNVSPRVCSYFDRISLDVLLIDEVLDYYDA